MLDLLFIAADLTTSVWIVASLVVFIQRRRSPDRPPNATARTLWAELRPFYVPAVVARGVGDVVDGPLWYAVLFLAINLFIWWVYKDIDDDDRWKRRREKLAATVKRVGARLTVAPVPVAGGA